MVLLRLVLFLFAFPLFADLRVYPTRLTLTDTKRVGDISLRHVGTQPARYRISTVFYKMKIDGSMEQSKTPEKEERTAINLIRFSPRQVTLPPNVEQVIRVMYSGPKDLKDGEYRVHLFFEPMDEPEETSKASKDQMQMKLQAKVAIAVPVVFKQGKIETSSKLANLKIVKMPSGEQGFSVDLISEGNGFPYGDFLAFFAPQGKAQVNIGIVRSVASYLKKRNVSYAFTLPADTTLAKGKLRLEYHQPEEDGGKLLTSSEITLP